VRRLGELESLAPARSAENVEPVVAKLAAEVFARLVLGFGDEDGAPHEATPLELLATRAGLDDDELRDYLHSEIAELDRVTTAPRPKGSPT
jgi:hypothetical protein